MSTTNYMTKALAPLVAEREREQDKKGYGRYGLKFHLMPRTGWLNDPNGLHQKDGVFHAYYQSSPFQATDGLKFWGHATSPDLFDWQDRGCALYPDTPYDVHGVYSGSCHVENDGELLFYYTGNVKIPDAGQGFNYVSTGREANTILVTSEDGIHFSDKRLVMGNRDYPVDTTCHVRDPKVFSCEEIDECLSDTHKYIMVQGARRGKGNAATDRGEVIVFGSDDCILWSLVNRITTMHPFGYMWECPDYFEVDGVKILSVSPQGLGWEGANIYQSGWFDMIGTVTGPCKLLDFHTWDDGFDFYAPQSFKDESGRRILIGWMGMPDAPEHVNKTLEDGWQGCFTLPREVVREDGAIKSRPVVELERYRGEHDHAEGSLQRKDWDAFDLVIRDMKRSDATVVLAGDLTISYRAEAGELVMRFGDETQDGIGGGRVRRVSKVGELDELRIVGDASCVEVFANGGEHAMTTRYYPERYSVTVDAPGATVDLWKLEK